ncbi:MAG TPA: hypothetical protein VGM44_14600, partial [Polyangiaceae bacterium]
MSLRGSNSWAKWIGHGAFALACVVCAASGCHSSDGSSEVDSAGAGSGGSDAGTSLVVGDQDAA